MAIVARSKGCGCVLLARMFRLESAVKWRVAVINVNHPKSLISWARASEPAACFPSDVHVFSVPHLPATRAPNGSRNRGSRPSSRSTDVSRRHLESKRTGVLGPVFILATRIAACSHDHSRNLCGELHCRSTWPHATPRGHELVAVWRLRGRFGLISEFLTRCSVPSRAARLRLHVGFCRLRKQCTDSMCLHLLWLEVNRIIIIWRVSARLLIRYALSGELFETARVFGMDVVVVDGQRFGGDDVCESL